MDDDDVQESGVIGEENPTTPAPANTTTTTTNNTNNSNNTSAAAAATPSTAEVPPTKPPRPLTEAQKNELILKEAFPSVEPSVIKAVLSASSGRVEPAFNALLGKTNSVKNNRTER